MDARGFNTCGEGLVAKRAELHTICGLLESGVRRVHRGTYGRCVGGTHNKQQFALGKVSSGRSDLSVAAELANPTLRYLP